MLEEESANMNKHHCFLLPLSSATMEKAVLGFKSTGLWPFNPVVFSAEDFRASLVTNEPQLPVNQPLSVASNVQVGYFLTVVTVWYRYCGLPIPICQML